MATFYIDTGGSATNSGTSDNNSATVSGTEATVVTSTVSLDGLPDLSFLSGRTSGATQAAIYLNDATNSNQKVFKITAFDNSLKTVTVSGTPTGITSTAWAIDGRHVKANGNTDIEGAVIGGDTVIFNNSPESGSSATWIFRNSGSTTDGYIKVMGATGVRPVFTATSSTNAISATNNMAWVENIEIVHQGATGVGCAMTGNGCILKNVRVSDAGAGGAVNFSGTGSVMFQCEISGSADEGVLAGASSAGNFLIGNYIHDNAGIGFDLTGNNNIGNLIFNVIDTCGGVGIRNAANVTVTTGTILTYMLANTVYGCGDSGIEITDSDLRVIMINNVLKDNGNAAGEYNIEFINAAAEFVGFHYYNLANKSSNNLSNFTINSTESTSDPLFTDAANGNFTLGGSSPAKATGFPGQFLGGSLGYVDMGALQRQESGNSGPILGGMVVR